VNITKQSRTSPLAYVAIGIVLAFAVAGVAAIAARQNEGFCAIAAAIGVSAVAERKITGYREVADRVFPYPGPVLPLVAVVFGVVRMLDGKIVDGLVTCALGAALWGTKRQSS